MTNPSGQPALLVASGFNYGGNTTELLSLTEQDQGWQFGPILPFRGTLWSAGSVQVKGEDDSDSVLIVGGKVGGDPGVLGLQGGVDH